MKNAYDQVAADYRKVFNNGKKVKESLPQEAGSRFGWDKSAGETSSQKSSVSKSVVDKLEREDKTLEKVSTDETQKIGKVEHSMADGVASEIKHPTGHENDEELLEEGEEGDSADYQEELGEESKSQAGWLVPASDNPKSPPWTLLT